MGYLLTGDFVECCDCFTVCPCWVSDIPDEDHCSGLYVWSFGSRSHIDNINVSGMHVAAATYHAVRAGGQALFFIDVGPQPANQDKKIEHLLYSAFSGKLDGTAFNGLQSLLGIYLGYHPATIKTTFTEKVFSVTVDVGGEQVAQAKGEPKIFKDIGSAMTLRDTALSKKLGIGKADVTIQDMANLHVDVAALPGGPLNFRGRSGMRSQFTYEFAGKNLIKQDAEDES